MVRAISRVYEALQCGNRKALKGEKKPNDKMI
jgi:hypothetical protein